MIKKKEHEEDIYNCPNVQNIVKKPKKSKVQMKSVLPFMEEKENYKTHTHTQSSVQEDKPENDIGNQWGRAWGRSDGEGVMFQSKSLYSFDFLKYINTPHIKLKVKQQE